MRDQDMNLWVVGRITKPIPTKGSRPRQLSALACIHPRGNLSLLIGQLAVETRVDRWQDGLPSAGRQPGTQHRISDCNASYLVATNDAELSMEEF